MPLGAGDRYIVQRLLGDGTFGRVLLCRDKVAGVDVAIKVIKDDPEFRRHAECEAEVLREIGELKSPCRQLCVQLHDTFLHCRRHRCLVFEPLGGNLRSFLKANKNLGLCIEDVRSMSKQLLDCIAFLHEASLIHTDLKSRNVLLRRSDYTLHPHPRVAGEQVMRPTSTEIVVVDFGSAVYTDDHSSGVVCTRQYRPPEVVLGLDWTEKVDVWSIACIVAMLYTGRRPFSVHEDMEHLAMIEQFIGAKLPTALCKQALAEGRLPEGVHFNPDATIAWPGSIGTEEAVARVHEVLPLRKVVEKRDKAFLRLLQSLFVIDPDKRISAREALKHQFFHVESGGP